MDRHSRGPGSVARALLFLLNSRGEGEEEDEEDEEEGEGEVEVGGRGGAGGGGGDRGCRSSAYVVAQVLLRSTRTGFPVARKPIY